MKREIIGYLIYTNSIDGFYIDNVNNDISIDDLFNEFESKRIKLTIEVLPDEIETKDDSVKIQVKLRTIVRNNILCTALGINPWCINEGADGDDYISVPVDLAKEHDLI